ncbi:MAG: SAM-dependent methyltransferase [Opitutaceae bacterium]|nr:SAM-dependent methyltransferase [Opitutaceae bacterium]
MGSCVSAEFLLRFAREPDAARGVPFVRFMELALYDPAVGYYTRPRHRIGQSPGTDYYTAESSGAVFGELVLAACSGLLRPQAARDFFFVEIGAEPGGGMVQGLRHPFAASEVRLLGEPLALPAQCVVFSNELFDAQPCHRLVRRGAAWRELGVALAGDRLRVVELPELSPEIAAIGDRLPVSTSEGYLLDLPLRASRLLETLVAPTWRGLFVAFDYGKTWRELCESTPGGTARAYYRHTLSNDLLARPGEQDLTCHICWDWLQATLSRHGFASPRVESQESFFTHHATGAMEAIITAEASRFSARKQSLLQLLHPGQMGQKFQVLWALRR